MECTCKNLNEILLCEKECQGWCGDNDQSPEQPELEHLFIEHIHVAIPELIS